MSHTEPTPKEAKSLQINLSLAELSHLEDLARTDLNTCLRLYQAALRRAHNTKATLFGTTIRAQLRKARRDALDAKALHDFLQSWLYDDQ